MVAATSNTQPLREEVSKLVAESKAIRAKAEKDDQQVTDEELKQIKANADKSAELKEQIKAIEKAEQERADAFKVIDVLGDWLDETQEPITRPNPSAGSLPKVKPSNDPNAGFRTPGEMFICVMEATTTGKMDNRLKSLFVPPKVMATAGSDEAGGYADPYGGFLIPKGFSPTWLSVPSELDPIADLTTKVPMDTAVLDIPARVDKDHSSSVSGGLRVYRRAETDTVTASRMEMEQVTLRAHSLFGLSYATEELLERSAISFIALLEAGFRDEFAAKMIDERLNGSGVGMYEGAMNSPCCISQDKETGQDADTIVYENVVNMRSRCWRYGQAVWLANHDTLPQLMKMTVDVGTSGVPVWQPSAREDRPDILLGRPIYFTEFCQTIGDAGDIFLGNWSQYIEGTLKPLQNASSVHVRFIYHERTFKFWTENDGRCWWRSELTPKNSTTTLSPFVKLAAR